MRYTPLYFLLFLLSCMEPGAQISSPNTHEFVLDLGEAGAQNSFPPSAVSGNDCNVMLTEIAGKNALKLTTMSEFSDALLDCASLFGHSLDFTKARYLHLRLYVPQGSWIKAMKLNFMDASGNFGGVPEVANNFHGNYDRWIDVVVDFAEYVDRFRNWHGKDNPLAAVAKLSLNPYCAHQADSSAIYLNRLAVSDVHPEGTYLPALADAPYYQPNSAFKFTFDDPAKLDQLMAYRAFESSDQAFATGIGGNESMAIRLRGRPHLNNIAFLPQVDKLTGSPVDFREVKRIYFDYYLSPGSDPFDGSTLYVVSEGWEDILVDTTFYDGFVVGTWNSVSVDLADLDLTQVKGDADVLPEVYEWRLNLNYRTGKKDIEMWMDNIGWE